MWEICTVPEKDVMLLRPSYLSHALQQPHEATPGRYYALTGVQIRKLIEDLERAALELENSGQANSASTSH